MGVLIRLLQQRSKDRQADRQAGRQTNRQTGKLSKPDKAKHKELRESAELGNVKKIIY